ncbi:MAG: alpha-glucosidase [Actinomycetota bacterium]
MSEWWKSAVVYQIYPRSFADANGDGHGDLPGLIDRLDYLAWLGVDAVWLSPHYPSPNVDWGYDVSDYTGVHPDFGTLDDFDRLVDEAHRRDLHVLADLVLNHTSDQHPWFVESRSSHGNPKRDWYVWRDGDDPPNNWVSAFGGPAWTKDETTGAWYYHFFAPEQPDLNWHNPEVRAAMWDVVRFWADRGVDGFRLDAVATIFEANGLPGHTASYRHVELIDQRFTDDPDRFDWEELLGYQIRQPPLYDLVAEIRGVADDCGDLLLIGEDDRLEYHGDGTNGLHLVFNFPLMEKTLTPRLVRENQETRLPAIPAGSWPCNVTGNHDAGHAASRFESHRDEWSRIVGALTLLLKGTAVIYQGDEIGMTDTAFQETEHHTDMIGRWYEQEAVSVLGLAPAVAAERAAAFSRDRCRTPMQWDASPNAGFTTGGPWLPVHPNHRDRVNVADERDDAGSMLSWYRRLIALRRSRPSIDLGDQQILRADDAVLVFSRTLEDEQTIVAVNMTEAPARCELADGVVLLSTEQSPADQLTPFEIRVIASKT